MHGARFSLKSRRSFGATPGHPDSDMGQDNREFARYLALAASALILLVLPTYQLIEFFLAGQTSSLWWQNAGWRALGWVAAVITLSWCTIREDGHGAPAVLRLLAVSLIVMMFGLFGANYLHADGDIPQMVNGLIIITFVVSLAALRGGRELMVIFGVPMSATLAVLVWKGEPVLEVLAVLLNVFTALGIALVTSELLHRTRGRSFRLQQELREHATTDPLTGLNNRRYIKPQLHSEVARAHRHGTTFAVLMADLDFFKRVNDEHGHAIGDEVLRILASRMLEALRREDRAVRWGGEEFLVLSGCHMS